MSTDIRLCYSRATATPRPAGSRQLVGYSPKLERRVALYSRHAFEQWLLLESDPSCQFPAYRSQFVFGVMAPVDCRHKGATSFSA